MIVAVVRGPERDGGRGPLRLLIADLEELTAVVVMFFGVELCQRPETLQIETVSKLWSEVGSV